MRRLGNRRMVPRGRMADPRRLPRISALILCILIVTAGCRSAAGHRIPPSELVKLNRMGGSNQVILTDTKGNSVPFTGQLLLHLHLKDGQEIRNTYLQARVDDKEFVGMTAQGTLVRVPLDRIEFAATEGETKGRPEDIGTGVQVVEIVLVGVSALILAALLLAAL